MSMCETISSKQLNRPPSSAHQRKRAGELQKQRRSVEGNVKMFTTSQHCNAQHRSTVTRNIAAL
jgi:hypothetical protein